MQITVFSTLANHGVLDTCKSRCSRHLRSESALYIHAAAPVACGGSIIVDNSD